MQPHKLISVFYVVCLVNTASDLSGQCEFAWKPADPYPGIYGSVRALVPLDPDGAGPRPELLLLEGDLAGRVSRDELFENFLPLVAEAFGGTGQTMHLHATDAPGEWQLTFEPDAVHVERMHAKGDVAVRGPAAALLLLLWHRTDTSAPGLEVFGDDDVLELWHQTAQF